METRVIFPYRILIMLSGRVSKVEWTYALRMPFPPIYHLYEHVRPHCVCYAIEDNYTIPTDGRLLRYINEVFAWILERMLAFQESVPRIWMWKQGWSQPKLHRKDVVTLLGTGHDAYTVRQGDYNHNILDWIKDNWSWENCSCLGNEWESLIFVLQSRMERLSSSHIHQIPHFTYSVSRR